VPATTVHVFSPDFVSPLARRVVKDETLVAEPPPPAGSSGTADEPAEAVFQQQWQLYRMLIDEDYLCHREGYACLRQILLTDAPRPFRFLDLGCGDATESATALSDTPIAAYHGIDTSQPALELASRALQTLACPVTLACADFVEALRERVEPADVVWIGLLLHHLRAPEKLAILRDVRRIVGSDGLLVLYEPTSPDGEDRTDWLRRWDAQQLSWPAYTPAQWERFTAHVHAADYPETVSGWRALAEAAGFRTVREVFATPSDLLRMYLLRPGADAMSALGSRDGSLTMGFQ
jgi:SAM-dependent methyltransferase